MRMQQGIRYIVTSPSEDGTFLKGDRIYLADNGDIVCIGQGWIPAVEVAKATKGMSIAVDLEWIAQHKKKLESELAVLDDLATDCHRDEAPKFTCPHP